MGKNTRNFLTPALISLPAASVVLLLFAWPIAKILFEGFTTPANLFDDSLIGRRIFLTYAQAFLSAIGASALGLWGAILCAEGNFPGKSWVNVFALICFSLPQILVVLAFFSFFGRDFALLMLGWPAVLFSHVLLNFGLFHQNVQTKLSQLDRSEELAALSLGASRLRTFIKVTLPKLWPTVRGRLSSLFFIVRPAFSWCSFWGGALSFLRWKCRCIRR